MKVLVKTKLIDPEHVEVRDYELGRDLKIIHCVAKDYKSCYHVGEDYMVLTVANQKKGHVLNTQMSKFPPYKYYKIYKFLWKPKGKVEGMQINPSNITFEGNKAILH